MNYISREIAINLLINEGHLIDDLKYLDNVELGKKFTTEFYFLDTCFFIS
jgi:hypothetical protein